MRLEGKVAIVTGAGSGFGEGIAKRFAAEGAAVIVADFVEEGGKRVTSDIESAGGKALYVNCDVTKRDQVKTMIDQAVSNFGKLDILVNNAGWTHRNKPLAEVTEDEFDRIFDVNVKAVYLAIQEALPQFEAQGGGCVINTASTAGLRPRPNLSVYNASKGAANVLTKSLAVELAPKKVRVNALCPVIGATGLLEAFMGVPDTPENRERFMATIPLGRFSTPEDLAAAALYLASDEANFITGVLLEVDGGRCI
ncbi:glucose 1-dehydrogenase [Rhodovibrionaceae bacterium A322]